jgi:hypothetical protein
MPGPKLECGRLTALHKLFWVALRSFWSGWTKPLVLVTPRTVVSWHRAGFRLYWTWASRARRVGAGRRVSKEVRALILRMVAENPTWGAPRIHGELLNITWSRLQSRTRLVTFAFCMASVTWCVSASKVTTIEVSREWPKRDAVQHSRPKSLIPVESILLQG